jgi:TolB protein
MSARRLSWCATLALLLTSACRDTNLEPPPPADLTSGMIVFASDRLDNNSEIYLASPDGRSVQRLTTSRDANDRAPALSPNGAYIAWEREITTGGGDVSAVELWIMRVDGSGGRAVVQNGSFNRSPSWAPDGAIVYTSRVTGSDQIWRVPLPPGFTPGTPVRLTTGDAADQFPRVSPDGSRILFQSNRGFDFDIYVMNADGSDVRNLTARPGDDRFPTWTPDGARVLWTRFDDATLSFDLWAMPAAGGAGAALVASGFNEMAPSVSPDGRQVVFQSDRQPPARLYIMPLAGGEARPLVTAAHLGSDQAPWWGPTAAIFATR